jgi:hypothetical protein
VRASLGGENPPSLHKAASIHTRARLFFREKAMLWELIDVCLVIAAVSAIALSQYGFTAR